MSLRKPATFLFLNFLLMACGGMPTQPPPERVDPTPVAKDEPLKRSVAPLEASSTVAKPEEKPVSRPLLKKKIVVFPFINYTQYGGGETGRVAALDIANTLEGTDNTQVLLPQDLDGLETFLTPQGDYNYTLMFDRARAHGVAGIITGAIEDLAIEEKGDEIGVFRSRYNTVHTSVRFQLFDASTQKTIHSRIYTGECSEEFTKFFGDRSPTTLNAEQSKSAIHKALEPVFEQFPIFARRIAWMGRIAKMDGQRYYLNAGESSGLLKGHLLKVYGEGEPVVDRGTGVALGFSPGLYKGTLRIVDYFGADGAVAVLHSGGGFKEEDRVEAYGPQR